jgi:hypothetical protein
MERLQAMLGGAIGVSGAVVSSLCCLLPLLVILLGLGSGAFMATTMKYTAVFVPIGIASVGAGFYLHVRERHRCARGRCRMAGGPWNLALLTFSALVVAITTFLALFPATASDLLLWAMTSRERAPSHSMEMPPGAGR